MAEIRNILQLRDDAAQHLGAEDPITQSLSVRLKKYRIAQEYRRRRKAGEEKKDLIFNLARKYYYSEKSIRNIVYSY